MNLNLEKFKEVFLAIAFIAAMAFTFNFHNDDLLLFVVMFFSAIVIAVFNRNHRQLYPILLIFIGIRFSEVIFFVFLMKNFGFTYLLITGLLELFFAFLLVHYSQDELLQRWCKVKVRTEPYPQIQWIVIILGLCCFYRLAASVEIMIHKIDNQFFQGEVPFFFSTGPTAMLIMRLAIDTLLWSMLLFPRKLAHFRVTPPPQATPD